MIDPRWPLTFYYHHNGDLGDVRGVCMNDPRWRQVTGCHEDYDPLDVNMEFDVRLGSVDLSTGRVSAQTVPEGVRFEHDASGHLHVPAPHHVTVYHVLSVEEADAVLAWLYDGKTPATQPVLHVDGETDDVAYAAWVASRSAGDSVRTPCASVAQV
jgi:hypothetical protein